MCSRRRQGTRHMLARPMLYRHASVNVRCRTREMRAAFQTGSGLLLQPIPFRLVPIAYKNMLGG
jgi:hypothetical protein